MHSYLLAKLENKSVRGSNSLDGYFYGASFNLNAVTPFVMESFGRTHEKPNVLTVCNRPFFLFKEKQLTWSHKNWTTKPQQGKRNGQKDGLGGMSYPSLRWLLGAENVYWYGDQGGGVGGGETNKVDTQGQEDCENVTGNGKIWAWIKCRNENSHKPALGLLQFHLETLQWVGCGYKQQGNELRPFCPPPTVAGVNQGGITIMWRAE